MKRKNDVIFWGLTKMTLPPSSEGVQYATGEEWRAITNVSRKNEEAGPKQKWHSVVDVSGVWCLVMKVKSDPIKNSIA